MKANQQSEAVCILAPGDLIGDDPPELLLDHTMVVEADQIDCSDYDRNKKNKIFKYYTDVESLNYLHYHINLRF